MICFAYLQRWGVKITLALMPAWKRPLGRLILLSFAFRALVPLGLMLQLPAADATGTTTPPAFVICPQQNPGLDLSQLIDASQPAGAHTHHSHHNHTQAQGDGTTISVDQSGSLCNLWSSSTDINLALVVPSTDVRLLSLQRFDSTDDATIFFNHYPTRLTRGPPTYL